MARLLLTVCIAVLFSQCGFQLVAPAKLSIELTPTASAASDAEHIQQTLLQLGLTSSTTGNNSAHKIIITDIYIEETAHRGGSLHTQIAMTVTLTLDYQSQFGDDSITLATTVTTNETETPSVTALKKQALTSLMKQATRQISLKVNNSEAVRDLAL